MGVLLVARSGSMRDVELTGRDRRSRPGKRSSTWCARRRPPSRRRTASSFFSYLRTHPRPANAFDGTMTCLSQGSSRRRSRTTTSPGRRGSSTSAADGATSCVPVNAHRWLTARVDVPEVAEVYRARAAPDRVRRIAASRSAAASSAPPRLATYLAGPASGSSTTGNDVLVLDALEARRVALPAGGACSSSSSSCPSRSHRAPAQSGRRDGPDHARQLRRRPRAPPRRVRGAPRKRRFAIGEVLPLPVGF